MKKIVAIIMAIVVVGVVAFGLYRWFNDGVIDAGAIFASGILLSYLFNWINWGDHDGGVSKDELEQHIKTQSAKIGYFVLMVLAAVILFVSEGTGNFNEMTNLPLIILVALTFVVLPLTEFFYARKYK
ncbi:hypothetical protein [Bacillus sp. JJ722]|uniref:hypothetical protein n=1 Tax=Bacillus sp. JJ722 TaxID=3122973 RepID=UPI002FFDC5FF